MWCSSCQQDVPGVSTTENHFLYRCPRCEQPVAGSESASPPPADTATVNTAKNVRSSRTAADQVPRSPSSRRTVARFVLPDLPQEWRIDDDLQTVRRLRTSLAGAVPAGAVPTGSKVSESPSSRVPSGIRLDAPVHALTDLPPPPVPFTPIPAPTVRASTVDTRTVLIAAAISIVITTIVLGGALLIFSMASTFGELWKVGLPIV